MRGLKKPHGEIRSGGQDKRSRPAGTTPADVWSKTAKLPNDKVPVPCVTVALVSEGYPDVKMEEDEDLVEVRETFAMAIDNVLARGNGHYSLGSRTVTSTEMLWLRCARKRYTAWSR